MNRGERVYWHGVSPDPKKQGTITSSNNKISDQRIEVAWDGYPTPIWTPRQCVMLVRRFGNCCVYCQALKERES